MRLPFTSRTTGGWRMPIARMEAASCSSIAFGAGVRRGLSGFGTRVVGSTLRNSAMLDPLVRVLFIFPLLREDPTPPPHPGGRGKGGAGAAGRTAGGRATLAAATGDAA